MAIESCCIPLPSEIVMPLAGIMLYQNKILPGTNPILGLILVALWRCGVPGRFNGRLLDRL